MPEDREVHVHLSPLLVQPLQLAGSIAVAVDVLRASTTIVHALAAGCVAVRPIAEVVEARRLADHLPAGKVLLAGERDGRPLPGFDCGNSPGEFTSERCGGTTLVLTTTNGTRALLLAESAARILVGAFVNFSAVCEQLRADPRPVHILCAGESGNVALEDTLFAGAVVEFLCTNGPTRLNDGARVGWDCFERHGRVLEGALAVGAGGARLHALGYDDDIRAAARVDAFALVPELRRDPVRVEIGAVGIATGHWHP
jgi:2-phosphosulfolactate phosphatase